MLFSNSSKANSQPKSHKNHINHLKKKKLGIPAKFMNELTSDKTIKMKRSKDNLAPLLGLLNNPAVTGAELPTGTSDEATPMPGDPIFEAPTTVAEVLAEANGPMAVRSRVAATDIPQPRKPLMPRVFTTGRMKVGKDFLLNGAGFDILGFADPLYQLSHYFFGEHPKDLTRDFLQKCGQWGRGDVSPRYPLTPERATFISMVRSLGDSGAFDTFNSEVDFATFGEDKNIWIAALLRRAEKYARAHAQLGVSNCRYQNEFDLLKSAGFTHFHVMASPASWLVRMKKDGLDPNSALAKDVSEKLAMDFDAAVYKTIARQRVGPKLRVVWCDDVVRPPSNRLLTIAEFKREVGVL